MSFLPGPGQSSCHLNAGRGGILLLVMLLCSSCVAAGAQGVPTVAVSLPSASAGRTAPARPAPGSTPAWVSGQGARLTVIPSGAELALELFTRLDVLERGPGGARVICSVCIPVVEGYLPEADLVTDIYPPEVAAWGTLPEFLLSVREAAVNRDMTLLRPVMAGDFTYAFVGVQTPDEAFAFWSAENFWSLDEMADLLDPGVRTTNGRIWAAPSTFVSNPAYHGARAGFRRRADGRWEWVYLIRDVNDRH